MLKTVWLVTILLLASTSLYGLKGKSGNSIKKLKEYNKKLGEFDNKLSGISNEILIEREAITTINRELKKIDRELFKDKKRYSAEKKRAEKLKKESKKLSVKQKTLRNRVVTTSAKLISLSVIADSNSSDSLDALILDEVFNILNKENVKMLKNFDTGLSKRQLKINNIQKKMKVLQDSIDIIEDKKKLIKKKKSVREKMFKRLESRKKDYKKRLESIIKKQKIIKAEIEKAQAKMEKARVRKHKRVRKESRSRITTHIGSSYKKEAVRRYRGKKTISPIKNYQVITKFGTYIDPIYKFKIFSSSVILKPNRDNSIVRNIFNGRVTLFKDDKTLGKFVMVEHFNGLQTMYAHLDSFSPSIKAGKKIKKGAVIGRVSERLYFEVMEKSYRINPLEVIE